MLCNLCHNTRVAFATVTIVLAEERKVFTDAAAVVVIGAGVKIVSYRASSCNNPKIVKVI